MAAIGRPLPPRAPRAARPPAVGPDAPFNASYVGSRPDLVEQLPETSRNILDLGCATGEVGVAIVKRIPEARVTGVELDPPMAAVAAGRIANVVSVDLEDLDAVRAALAGERFDAVIAGDILEHLVDPWRALRGLQPVLTNDALIIASLPNIGFWDTWWNVLVHRRWPYRPRGIHDSTHLRFFAGRNIQPLFEQAGFRVDAVVRKYRLIEPGHRWNRRASWFAIPGLRDLLTFQFIVIARRDPSIEADGRAGTAVAAEFMPPARNSDSRVDGA